MCDSLKGEPGKQCAQEGSLQVIRFRWLPSLNCENSEVQNTRAGEQGPVILGLAAKSGPDQGFLSKARLLASYRFPSRVVSHV